MSTRDRIRELLAQGMSNKQMARLTNRAESVVKYHCTLIFAELGVRNRTQAALKLAAK